MFHATIAMSSLQPRPTLAESLIACALLFSGDVNVAKAIGNNIACYPADLSSAELHEEILASLKRHAEMGAAVADEVRCAQRLTTTFLRWYSQRQHAA